jgi:hypothetical protein
MTATDPSEDAAAGRVVSFLEAEGAARQRHGAGRTLLDHLRETAAILGRWGQPPWLQRAALLHSVYGTDVRRRQLIDLGRRAEVAGLAGDRAERLAYLFATIPRKRLFAGTHRWAPGAVVPEAGRDEFDAVVMLHLANLAEQARAEDGSPGLWLVRAWRLADLLAGSSVVALPPFAFALANITPSEESGGCQAYRNALDASDPATRVDHLGRAAAACPVVGEPCVWLADAASRRGDPGAASDWARLAEHRLRVLGVAWDKRLPYEDWIALAGRLADDPGAPGSAPPADPRALHHELSAAAATAPPAPRLDPSASARRFARYMDALADAETPGGRVLYPDLQSQPWFAPETFPIAIDLERRFGAIRAEILALDPSTFAPESERIQRTGDWDVIFLYERGRRHDDVCEACPATASVIEGDGAMRTAAGLIYVSRMRAGTHIAAHRGPTNLRVRCHLGVVVPDGDCAIRVRDESRRWQEGRCLVFDDSHEHEAWNRTAGDRIVLIVDLWHPALSRGEVHRLSGLHRYAAAYAGRLQRYWSINEAARAT